MELSKIGKGRTWAITVRRRSVKKTLFLLNSGHFSLAKTRKFSFEPLRFALNPLNRYGPSSFPWKRKHQRAFMLPETPRHLNPSW